VFEIFGNALIKLGLDFAVSYVQISMEEMSLVCSFVGVSKTRDASFPTIVAIPTISKFLQKFPTISYYYEIPLRVKYLPRIAQNCSL